LTRAEELARRAILVPGFEADARSVLETIAGQGLSSSP